MPQVTAIFADNSEAWVAIDDACFHNSDVCIPLPTFFSEEQLRWALNEAAVTRLLTDQPTLALWQQLGFSWGGYEQSLARLERNANPKDIPSGTVKITFTSGSTGHPKGVCLAKSSMDSVANDIADVMQLLGIKKHLCALPLPLLLENVAGVYAAKRAGIELVVPGLRSVGWSGSSVWDPRIFLDCVQRNRIESAIVLPQMLKAMLPNLSSFDIASLKFLAVGGAQVSPRLLAEARAKGLPVYEGYGLSECGSVVSINRPGADKPGTVGKLLPHVRARTSANGELLLAGDMCYLGYLGQVQQTNAEWLETGDLAEIDAEGFLTLRGRQKHVIVSSFGRNISPEWVESELLAQEGILQAAVFGEAHPFLSAVLVAPSLTAAALQSAIIHANAALPDYARVKKWVQVNDSFSAGNGLATSNGRNKRDAIAVFYRDAISSLYRGDFLDGLQ